MQGVSSKKTVHWTVFLFTSCGALCNCGALPQANRPSPSVALRHLPTRGAASDLTGTSPLSFGHLPILWGVTPPKEHSPFGIPFIGSASYSAKITAAFAQTSARDSPHSRASLSLGAGLHRRISRPQAPLSAVLQAPTAVCGRAPRI